PAVAQNVLASPCSGELLTSSGTLQSIVEATPLPFDLPSVRRNKLTAAIGSSQSEPLIPDFAMTGAMNSASVLAGIDGCATTRFTIRTSLAAGATSLRKLCRAAESRSLSPHRPAPPPCGIHRSRRQPPFSAASRLAGSDIVPRIVAQWLTESLRPPFIVENRAGAAGNIAARAVIGSQPNGYRPLWLRPQAP